MKKELFEHFKCLSIAINILVCPLQAADISHRRFAGELLKYFVDEGRSLYGPEFLVYNVHTLLHVVSDVEVHGNLDRFSAFSFESYLHELRKLIRSGRNPLVQLVKRLSEIDCNQRILHRRKTHVTTKQPNNAYVLSNDSCCEVTAHAERNDHEDDDLELQYLCRVYDRTEPFFRVPCD